ncbi:calcium-binding protein [Blastococcus sp. BMG 814]|uniref:Calcium-binding protein n=1 Tax=Blastococcus carthaginiensis TaxID=3050034 RepID=A0ABT9IDZ4_9ACTN|nr:calcium-binding protein [Blastococcus carthaginiensis]MDP5183793.1 calcium-binding protein [Blastococcus carthaginiensis]
MKRRTSVLPAVLLVTTVMAPATAAQAATPLCFGKPATIVGTAGADVLVGQSGVADVIYGAGGDDRIVGGDFYSDDAVPGLAADLLCGGPGADAVTGGPGNDKINGGDGNDVVNGGRGADVVQGNAGDDQVVDESSADMDAGNDTLRGDGGHDRITVAWGIDKAYGGAGDDTITDTECSTSYLYGGTGADTFESYRSSFEGWTASYCPGKDYVNGNEHHDSALVSQADAVTGVESLRRVSSAVG